MRRMDPSIEAEVSILVFSQMGFCVFGTLLNNIVFITLKDLPEMRASTHNVILAHLTFVNLIVCTFVKPITAVYVAYAHAKGNEDVGLEFCLVYTVISWSTLSILPWSVCALSWHLLFSARRARERATGIPRHATNIFGDMIPLATAFIDGEFCENPGDHRRNRIKAQTMEDGPRKNHKSLLILLWLGAGAIAAAKYLSDQSGPSQRIGREYFVRTTTNSTHDIKVTRDTDITFCKVWSREVGVFDHVLLVAVLLLPLAAGPLLTAVIEVFSICFNCRKDIETPSRWRPLALVHALAILAFCAHITNLWGAETIVGGVLGMPAYIILLVKYVAGYLDLLLVPLLILLLDREVGQGVAVVFRIKRLKRENTLSSSSLGI